MGARYHRESVDALSVPSSLEGLRTIFSGFHHFRPEAARHLLEDAVEKRQPMAVFETTQRSLKGILMILVLPFLVVASAPFIRPIRLTRLLLTYLVPIIPLFVLWDGIVSTLRTYTPREMARIARDVAGSERYEWRAGEVRGKGPMPMSYLIGRPRA